MGFVNRIKGWGQRPDANGDVIEEVRPSVDPYAAADDLAVGYASSDGHASSDSHAVGYDPSDGHADGNDPSDHSTGD